MTENIFDIKATDWSISVNGIGQIAQGLEDIRQCIGLILTTSRGSDPLRPEFGTDIFRYLDRPVNQAAPAIVSEILTGIQAWERRVKVKKIEYLIESEKILVRVTVQVLQSNTAADILFEVDRLRRLMVPRPYDAAFAHGFSIGYDA